jgi:hypothetical protein
MEDNEKLKLHPYSRFTSNAWIWLPFTLFYISWMGANSGAGTAYPSGAHEFSLCFFSEVHVGQSLVFCVIFVDRCLTFSICSLYCLSFFNLWLFITPFGHLQTFRKQCWQRLPSLPFMESIVFLPGHGLEALMSLYNSPVVK